MMLLCAGTPSADVLHLKDGRSLSVESWRIEGDQIVFEIAGGSVTIPRSLVVKIDPSAPPRKETPAPESGETPVPPPVPPAARPPAPPGARAGEPALPAPSPVSDSLSDTQLRDAVDSLKRRLRDDPRHRETDSREIARGLSLLAMRLIEKRDRTGAESLFAEALTYDSRCLPALIGLSASYLKEGKDMYARAQIQEALVFFPKDPTLHDLLGTVYYQQENVADAISEWETSLLLRNDPQVAARLEKARRELQVDHGYSRSEAAHFTLRYDGGAPSQDLLGASIRDYLEEKYLDLADKFHFVPPAPFVVILYPTREFHEMTHLPASVVGLFDGKIRIPIGGLKALNPPARAVLTHELTHAFVFGKTGGNCPRWLQEGLAQFMEGRPLLASEERGLARDLAASEGKSWYDAFTYPSSLSFTRYLADRFGFEALVETLDRMRGGLTAEDALKETTREEFSELQKEWMDGLLKKFAERS
jgi:tetratricopeptide (TPR) repeat protein